MAPAAVQTKHSVEENTTSPPAVSTQAEIASPGTPSRSPMTTTFLPAKMLIFHSFLFNQTNPYYVLTRVLAKPRYATNIDASDSLNHPFERPPNEPH
jgi:hypothetical protein